MTPANTGTASAAVTINTAASTTTGPTRSPPKPLIALPQALAELLAQAVPLARMQSVATLDADARVLAQHLLASLSVPAHDNSAMDGYAVRCADWLSPATTLRVNQRIAAGMVHSGNCGAAAGSAGHVLAVGCAARIFTGAPIPLGADAVVPQEDCTLLPASTQAGTDVGTGTDADADAGANAYPTIRLHTQPRVGQCIRRLGEDVAAGQVVLGCGTRLTPAALGLAASIGFDTLQVAAPVRVALFSTGDELVMPGAIAPQHMPLGAVYNSNRFFLRALLQRLGCTVTDMGTVPDDLAATVAALSAASQTHDLVLTSGGVSVGDEDHIKPAVQALGQLNLWQIAIKPGKPFAYGRVGTAHFIGLPGNPTASFVTFLLLVRPFILALLGVAATEPTVIALPAHFDWPKADKRREFLRVRQNATGGLDLFDNQSSGVLTSAVWADGLVDNPAGTAIARGDLVRFMPLCSLMS